MSISTLEEKQRPVRMLLVEDNKGDIMLFKRAFAQSAIPHEITVARTGEEALEQLDSRPMDDQSDMILLDLNLPGMSGHEVLRAVKAHERHKRIPVFVLSSSRAPEDVVSSYEQHANCYLVKPHDFDALKEITHRIGQFWFSLAVLPNGETRRYVA
jgi:chemotaxis family two-component system response regulator Rcp1